MKTGVGKNVVEYYSAHNSLRLGSLVNRSICYYSDHKLAGNESYLGSSPIGCHRHLGFCCVRQRN